MSYPVLAFHGTEVKNIIPICETGFRIPGISVRLIMLQENHGRGGHTGDRPRETGDFSLHHRLL